jgi:endonuclease-3
MLPLGPDPRTATIRRLQALLVQRFGHIERVSAEWRQPEWVLVQGVIGARTRSEVSNAATDRLLQRWGSWEAVATAPLADLQAELATQTYPNVAAGRLQASLAVLIDSPSWTPKRRWTGSNSCLVSGARSPPG